MKTILLVLGVMTVAVGCGGSGSKTTGTTGTVADMLAAKDMAAAGCKTGAIASGPVSVTSTVENLTTDPSCFQIVSGAAGTVTVEGDVSAAQTLSVSITFSAVNFDTSAPCTFPTGSDISLTDDDYCLEVDLGNDDYLMIGGYEVENMTNPSWPLPAGSIHITSWPTQAGQTLSLTFSDDAVLLGYPNGAGSPKAGTGPVSFAVSGTITGPLTVL